MVNDWLIGFISSGSDSSSTVPKETRRSLRRDKIDYSTEDVMGLNVTPEFKQFVAGKLAEIIDK